MGSLTAYANSASEDFGFEESCTEHEECASSNKQMILQAILLDDLDNFSDNEDDELMVQELGVALNGILHAHDAPTSDRNGICDRKEIRPSTLLDTNTLKDLSKCATVLCSEVAQPYPLTLDGKEGLSSTIAHIETLLKADSPTYACSISLPTTPKLVSAMKGGRARQQGAPLEARLSVRWAPEVYDPPVTSDSHTVKGGGHSRRHHHHHHHHHHIIYRSKAKKDPHKQGHSKIKSPSRGSGADRKHAYRSSTATGS